VTCPRPLHGADDGAEVLNDKREGLRLTRVEKLGVQRHVLHNICSLRCSSNDTRRELVRTTTGSSAARTAAPAIARARLSSISM
jgi:hypothetical protein